MFFLFIAFASLLLFTCFPPLYAADPNPTQSYDPYALKQNKGVWIETDLLFWNASMDGLGYAVTSDSTDQISHGRIKHPEFNWDVGFRLGLGYQIPHDKWDLFLNYTHIRAEAHGGTKKSAGAVFPTFIAPFTVDLNPGDILYATRAKAHFHSDLNMCDLELGRRCSVGRWLNIRPFMGLKGGVIDQRYRIAYQGGTVSSGDEWDQISIEQDFWGVGLRMGFDSLWGLGKGWALYGNGAASLLSGNFDIRQIEKLQEAHVKKLDLSKEVDNIVVAAEVALGIQWDYLFSQDRYHFGLKFGWEFNVFFDQNQSVRFVSDQAPGSFTQNEGDLSFQGLTLGLR
ncbi:MAG: hypothetical protein HYZ48_05715, partial [Chlamydiales bacterium]|nr:hypothetical protein [Chlamydiales bacterium]